MTETSATEEQDVVPRLPDAAVKRRRRGGGFGWLLLLLWIALACAGWLGWRQLTAGQQTQAQALAQWQSHQQAQEQALRQDTKAQAQQLASLQDQVLLHGQKLATLGEGGATLWLLNEAKSLASLAQQRLLLTADLPAARQLLNASDQVLAHIDDPKVLPARRALAQDMQKLDAAQQLDTTAILLQLGALMNQSQQLTLPEASDKSRDLPTENTVADAAETGWWQRLLARLPLDIQRSDAPLPLPLAPAQLAQVRLSFAMNLQQAQLALLQGRAAIYAQALAQADATLATWFAATDTQVKGLRAALAQLQKVHINQALPQIGAGLEAIEALLHPATPAQGG